MILSPRSLAVSLATVWLLAFSGCKTESSEAKRAEAGKLLLTIDRVRQLPAADRSAMLQVLRQTPCKASALCDTKDLCIQSYELQARAKQLTAKARSQMGDVKTDKDPMGLGVASLLERATSTLKRAADQATQCIHAQGQARQKYKL